MFDYPRSCAGMVVMKGDTVLVLRRGHPPRKGWLDIPGGFMEARESPAEAARRELEPKHREAYAQYDRLVRQDKEALRAARLEKILGAIQNNLAQIPELKDRLRRLVDQWK